MTEILLWGITALLLTMLVIEWIDIWRNRPIVVWDEFYGRWRAARGRYQGDRHHGC